MIVTLVMSIYATHEGHGGAVPPASDRNVSINLARAAAVTARLARSSLPRVATPEDHGQIVRADADYGLADGRVDAGLAARRLFVLACQFGADLVGVGVTGTWAKGEDGARLVQDGQCLLPGGAGRGLVASGRMGVAEVAEHRGQVATAADFPVPDDRLLIVVS